MGEIYCFPSEVSYVSASRCNITTPEGQNISTNLKVNPEDLELIEDLKNMTR